MAYKSRLKFGEPMNIQWENYPDLELEKKRFSICKILIEITQKLVDQNQTKGKDETQQQDQQPPTTPQTEKQEIETPPQEKLSENSKGSLLRQVVEDSKENITILNAHSLKIVQS